MRKELKSHIPETFELNEHELNLTIDIVDSYISAIVDQLNTQLKTLIFYDPSANPSYNMEDGSNEVAADLEYYTQIDIYFIHHFALWRLQGIFEGLLTQLFFKNTKLSGLKKKLDKLIQLGYIINKIDYEELLDWARLRNSLSHFPPQKCSPLTLTKEDIVEYKDLIERVFKELDNQEKKNNRR